jgi:hypothetical protein
VGMGGLDVSFALVQDRRRLRVSPCNGRVPAIPAGGAGLAACPGDSSSGIARIGIRSCFEWLWCKFNEGLYLIGFALSIGSDLRYAAKAACQISGMLAIIPPSLPIWNCPFLIFSANSIPLITTAAVWEFFRPTITRMRCLTRR